MINMNGTIGLLHFFSHVLMATITSGKTSPAFRRSSSWRQSLGLQAADSAQIIKAIQKGLPYLAVVKLQTVSGFTSQQIAAAVQVPLRTLARRKTAGRLAPDESDRLVRVGFAFDKALELFEGNRAAAQHWLSTPAKAFAGETPLAMLQTELGAREVEDLIGRLEHGVFS